MFILGDHPSTGGKRLSVAVEEASDRSYIDVVVTNQHGQIAAVALKLDAAGNLVVHAEDWTVKGGPYPSDEARVIIDDVVLAAGAFDARPVEEE